MVLSGQEGERDVKAGKGREMGVRSGQAALRGRRDGHAQGPDVLMAMYNILQSKIDGDGSYFAWYSGDG